MLGGLPRTGGGRRKKLEEAARLWASGAFDNNHDEEDKAEIHAAAAAFGLQVVGEVTPEREVFHLWPEHAEAWRLFMECQTEWRGSGHREGLCKEGVERILRALRVRPSRRRERFLQLRVMERAVLTEWARQRAEADRQHREEAERARRG